jgi:hypothetical protein
LGGCAHIPFRRECAAFSLVRTMRVPQHAKRAAAGRESNLHAPVVSAHSGPVWPIADVAPPPGRYDFGPWPLLEGVEQLPPRILQVGAAPQPCSWDAKLL